LSGGIEENHDKLKQDSQLLSQDLNPRHPKYEAWVITTEPQGLYLI
jgi:hypothetical protein